MRSFQGLVPAPVPFFCVRGELREEPALGFCSIADSFYYKLTIMENTRRKNKKHSFLIQSPTQTKGTAAKMFCCSSSFVRSISSTVRQLLGTDIIEQAGDPAVGHGELLRKIAQTGAQFAIRPAVLRQDDLRSLGIGPLDIDRKFQ